MGQFIHLLQNNTREVCSATRLHCKRLELMFFSTLPYQPSLNNQTNLDDLSLNLESFQGGLDCNVEEVRRLIIRFDQSFLMLLYSPLHLNRQKVIKHELSYGPLDFNFQNNNNQEEMGDAVNGLETIVQQPTAASNGQYPARTSTPSWVH